MFYSLNIEKFCNHKLIYAELPKTEEFGLDNICILKDDFRIENPHLFKEVGFNFVFGNYDNIVCERQTIEIGLKVKKIHIIGFAYWGNICEHFTIVYEDGSKECAKIPFFDWSHRIQNKSPDKPGQICGLELFKTVITSGRWVHLAYFHHSTYEVSTNKVIKEIILPDNMFVHIQAITLED